jgi:hypothetical protein
VTVQRSQASVERGQNAGYTVTVSTENGPATDVSVALTAQPSSQKPALTSGCAKSNGTAACAVGSVTAKSPVSLHAQIPAGSDATSVRLIATASIVTTATWTPPSAAVTVAVTVPAASPTGSSASSSAPATPGTMVPGTTLPLGPIPDLNNASSSVINAGDASGLFPSISPSATPTPSPAPGTRAASGKPNTVQPVAVSSTIGFGEPVLTGQVIGLITLGLAIMLTAGRLSMRRRSRSGKDGS